VVDGRFAFHYLPMTPTIIESGETTGVLDTDSMRFLCLLKNTEIADEPGVTDWRPYHRLRVSPERETFTAYLDAEGSRRIRSARHVDGRKLCGPK
jgi:hypothetical protein